MCMWGYLRHFINLKLLLSIFTEMPYIGPYELNWTTQQYKCWIAQYISFTLLASLQAVNLFWWFLICRIAYRFVVFKDADDDRSEYEPSEEETEERHEDVKSLSIDGVSANGTGEAAGVKRGIENVDAPSTPVQTKEMKEPETIGSRVKQRKKGDQS